MSRALFALAVGAFGIGCTEFIVTGLLPQIAAGVHATVPAIGILITAYAIGVLVGAPTLTALGSRLSSRHTLMVLMGVFIAGNALSAVAPNFQVLLVARVITSFAHGSFFGVGAIAARRVVAPEKATQAISLMFVGLTVANVVGVPLGTWAGQHFGWRYVFGAIALLGVVTILALRAYLPVDQHRIDLRSELASFKRRQVWIGLGITTVGFGSLFAVYSYVSPILTGITGLSESAVTLALVIFGLGTMVGTLAGGRFGDRWGLRAVMVGLLIISGLMAVFTVTSRNPVAGIATLVLFGMTAFALGPILQNIVIVAAGSGGSLVSAANQGAFNVANAIGAALGALVIKEGLGYVAPMWVASGLALLGAVLVAAVLMTNRPRGATRNSTPTPEPMLSGTFSQ